MIYTSKTQSVQASRKDTLNSLIGSIMEATQKKNRSLPSNFSCPHSYATMDVSIETLKAESRFSLKQN